MYELEGQQFTLEQIEEAARQSNLALDEYVAKTGMTKILESSLDFQNPTMPGAVVGENQAPDTESNLENTSSDSAKINIPNIPFPVTVTTDERSTDGMSYDDIYQQEINNTIPRFAQSWQDAKAFAVDWYRKKGLVIPGNMAVTQATQSINKIPAVQDLKENVSDFLFKNLIYKKDDDVEFRDATEKFMIDTYNKSAREQDKIKSSGSLVKGITELNPKEFAGGIAQVFGSLVTTMVPAIATGGASIYPQMGGQMYVGYNTEKAKALYGDDPEAINKLIEENKTEVTIPALLAGVASAAEFVGMKGVTGEIFKNLGKGSISNFAKTFWAAGGEGGTELFQSGVEAYNIALGQGKTNTEAASIAFNTIFSEQGAESFLQGAFGGGIMSAGGQSLKKAYITAREQGNNMGIVPNNISKLANLKRERATTTDETVREGLDLEIEKLENETKSVIKESNEIVDNASEQEVTVLADAQTALELYKTRVSTLVAKLEAGEITQQEHDFALTGYVNEYTKSQEAAKNTIGEISSKNQQASKNNEELLGVIKNPESTEQQIATAKNKLVENNQGLINNIVNKNFNPTLDTTLTKDDFTSEVNVQFSNLINSYKPESGTPFGAYVAQNLPRRLPAIFDKLVETKTNEEGKKEIISKQDITEKQIEGEITTQGEVKLETEKTKSVKNKLFTSKIGFDKKFVPGQTDKTFADVFSEAVAKTFGTSLPEVTDKNFVKEFQKKNRAELTPIIQNLLKKDKNTGVDNFKIFLEQNFDEIINQLPQNVINKKYKMLREAVTDEQGNRRREATKEGNVMFTKVQQEKADFIKYFTDPELGSSTRSDRKQSLLRTLVDELSADAALTVVKDKDIMDKFKSIQEVEGKKIPDNLEKTILQSIDRIDGLINDFEAFLNDKDVLRSDLGITNGVVRTIVLFLKGVKASLKQGLNLAQAIKENIGKLNLFFKSEKLTKPEQDLVAEVVNEINSEGKLPTANDLKQRFRGKSKDLQRKSFNEVIIPLYKDLVKDLKTGSKELLAKDFYSNYYRTLRKLNEVDQAGVTKYFKNIFGKDINLTVNNSVVKINGNRIKPNIVDQTQTARFIKKFKVNENSLREKQKKQAHANRDQLVDLLDVFKKGYKKDKSTLKESFYVLNGLGNDMNSLGKKYQVLGKEQNNEAIKKGAKMTLEHNPPYDGILANVFLPYIQGKVTKKDLLNSMASHKLELILKTDADKINKNLKESMPSGFDYFKDDPVVRLQTVKPEIEKSIEKPNAELNEMLERTRGIASTERVSVAKAKTLGAKNEKIKLFLPNTAEDLLGLLYRFAGKGKQGDADLKWIKQTFTRPLTRANLEFEALQVRSNEFLKEAKAIMTELKIDLTKEAIDGYTVEQAIRIHLWTKRGFKVPGMDQNINKEPGPEQAKVNQWVRQNFDSLEFTDAIEQAYIKNESKYPEPDEDWISGTITTDLLEFTNTQTRAETFQPFFDNINAALGKFDKFNGKLSGPTINKIRSIYGNTFVEALESSFYRISTGKNRTYQLDKQGGVMLDWLNNAIGNIMFINTRSALLQTISAANFVNWSDNNPLNAAKAWANQPKFWKYFNKIFFSDYLESRRSGLRTDVNEQEIATAAANSKNPTRAVIATILKKGFMPTQYADSFAIAYGGSSFLSNREAKYKKDGMSEQDAFDKAFEDMREIAEDTQQSGRPEKISQEQSGFAGRLILSVSKYTDAI